MIQRRRLLVSLIIVAFPYRMAYAQRKGSDDTELADVKLETVAATDEQIVKIADRAFVGEVLGVEIKRQQIYGVDRPVPVRSVDIKVTEVLFDQTSSVSTTKPYTVRMYAEGSASVNKGERILWFLARNTEDGLTQPVGIDSGFFRFTKDGKSVINLKRNENLLKPTQIRAQVSELASELPSERRDEFLKDARHWTSLASDSGEKGKPVPLDLLIARTKFLAHSK